MDVDGGPGISFGVYPRHAWAGPAEHGAGEPGGMPDAEEKRSPVLIPQGPASVTAGTNPSSGFLPATNFQEQEHVPRYSGAMFFHEKMTPVMVQLFPLIMDFNKGPSPFFRVEICGQIGVFSGPCMEGGGCVEDGKVKCTVPAATVEGAEEKKAEAAPPAEGKKEVVRMGVTVGMKAPDFTAPAYYKGSFTTVKLSDFAGKWVALCFYPGDFTFV